MNKKLMCWLLAFALVLVSGGDRLILPVGADSIAEGAMDGSETITMMPDFAEDGVMVVLTHEASLQFIDYTPADFPEVELAEVQDFSSAKGAKVQAVLRGEQLDMDSVGARFMNQDIDIDGFQRVLYLKLATPGEGNVLRAVAALEQRDDVYSAAPDYIFQALEPQAVAATEASTTDYTWADEKIQLEDAWDIEMGSYLNLKVGVLDSGIDVTHPELNGQVSLSLSRNFVTDDDYSATQDPTGHGTHVAGIIGAKYNSDAMNFSGVCPYISLVSLRVINESGRASYSAVAEAVNHAERNNIPILNVSLVIREHIWTEGSDSPNIPLRTAISLYTGLLVCSAGNENLDLKNVDATTSPHANPAIWDYNNILTVGASNQNDARWVTTGYASNYDTSTAAVDRKVDIFAPGSEILSCFPRSLCSTSNCTHSGHVSYGYHYMSGTSMAAPFVTGVAALILASHPDATPAIIKSAILFSDDNISNLSNLCFSGGRLNAYKAIISKTVHTDLTYTSLGWVYHQVTCNDCGATWQEEHKERPGVETCVYCGEFL